MADVKQKKAKIIKNIKDTGVINKKDTTQPKAYKNILDVLTSYDDSDVIFTYKGKHYTQKDYKDKFKNIEFFIKPCVEPKLTKIEGTNGDYTPVLTLTGEPIMCSKINHKASGSKSKTRHLPDGWVILKRTGDDKVYCVNPIALHTNPMVQKRQYKLFPNKYDYIRNYTAEDTVPMIRILSNTEEFLGTKNKKYSCCGNSGGTKLRTFSDEKILGMVSRFKKLHEMEVYDAKNNTNTAKGENQRIMDEYGLGDNRGIATDIKLWLTLLSDGKTVYTTQHSKDEGVFVIPDILAHKFISMITNKRPEDVWEEV